MIMYFNTFLYIYFFVLMYSPTDANFKQLEGRVRVIEQKIFYDSMEFRESIASLFTKVNDTFVAQNTDNNISFCTTKDEHDKKVKNQRMDFIETTNKKILKITYGISDEKKYVRTALSQSKRKLSEVQTGLKRELRTIKEEIEIKLSDFRQEFTAYCKNINVDIQDIKQDLASLKDSEHIVKAQNDRIETLESNMVLILNDIARLNKTARRQWDCGAWNIFGHSCYFVSKDTLPWNTAYSKCQTMDAHLAEIYSSEENDYLIGLVNESSKLNVIGPWIGGTDLEKDGIWQWKNSGRRINDSFSYWKAKEPNGGSRENCLHMYKTYGYKWNDARCTIASTYICERNASLIWV